MKIYRLNSAKGTSVDKNPNMIYINREIEQILPIGYGIGGLHTLVIPEIENYGNAKVYVALGQYLNHSNNKKQKNNNLGLCLTLPDVDDSELEKIINCVCKKHSEWKPYMCVKSKYELR